MGTPIASIATSEDIAAMNARIFSLETMLADFIQKLSEKDGQETISTAEAALLLGVTTKTINEYANAKKLNNLNPGGRKKMFLRNEVLKLKIKK